MCQYKVPEEWCHNEISKKTKLWLAYLTWTEDWRQGETIVSTKRIRIHPPAAEHSLILHVVAYYTKLILIPFSIALFFSTYFMEIHN